MRMKRLCPIEVLLSIVDPDYPNDSGVDKLINSNQNNILKTTLRLAERNGLRHHFIQRLIEMDVDLSFLKKKELLDEAQRAIDFKETITFLNGISKKHELGCILIKLFGTIPHTPNDIDIFIRKEDRQKLMTILEDNDMVCIHSKPSETKFKGRYMKIDIYTEIQYVGIGFIDKNFLRESVAESDFLGVKYPGLNNKADFLLLLPHALFGHRRLTLLDFLHLKNLRKSVNISECREYACEKGWGKVFDLILNQLDSLYQDMYVRNDVIHFPYIFNRGFVLECISQLDDFDKNKFNPFAFNISFCLEEVMYRLEGTALYNAIKYFEPTRNLFNNICSIVKSKMGYRA